MTLSLFASALANPVPGLFIGDCRAIVRGLPDNSVDALLTDAPYELGFMGKSWDSSGIAYDVSVWREFLRVLKPGGHLASFSHARTYHRMACAIEDSGFEIRDQLMWLYGTGFPKSLNFTDGTGTALKPAHEPICLARKQLDGTVAENLTEFGTGALNIDACRIGDGEPRPAVETAPTDKTYEGWGTIGSRNRTGGETTEGRWPANVLMDEDAARVLDDQAGVRTSGSMRSGTYAGRKGVAYGRDAGRPLKVDIVGSSGGASRFFYCAKASTAEREAGLEAFEKKSAGELTSRKEGSAGLTPRAGAGRASNGRANTHPTVKPIALMRWLARLIMPIRGGILLDPFLGSGSTGCAAALEGFDFIGCDLSPEYVAIAQARIAYWQGKAS